MLMVMAHPALLALSPSRGRQRKGGREGGRTTAMIMRPTSAADCDVLPPPPRRPLRGGGRRRLKRMENEREGAIDVSSLACSLHREEEAE